jgi:hypothetical protein
MYTKMEDGMICDNNFVGNYILVFMLVSTQNALNLMP